MSKEAAQKLKYPSAKKHSVQFKQGKSDKNPLFSSVYLMREGAAKLLGVKTLDEVEEIEVTVKIIK
jgi:hypothetical protein